MAWFDSKSDKVVAHVLCCKEYGILSASTSKEDEVILLTGVLGEKAISKITAALSAEGFYEEGASEGQRMFKQIRKAKPFVQPPATDKAVPLWHQAIPNGGGSMRRNRG